MEQNKTGKYFKYAIGEIILVVIGILIALNINNWNQKRLNRVLEMETLTSLKIDLDAALEQMDEKIQQSEYFYTYDSIILDVIHYHKSLPKDSIAELLLSHVFTAGFDPELGTLNEILNTGKMDIIKSNELRNHISSWNKYMDELEEVERILLHYDREVKEPLYSKHLPYKNLIVYSLNDDRYKFPLTNFDWNPEELLYTLELENMLSNYVFYGYIQNMRFVELKEKMVDMQNLINADIGID